MKRWTKASGWANTTVCVKGNEEVRGCFYDLLPFGIMKQWVRPRNHGHY